ncbi:unnamed protein product [Rhizoctonia solani]|uniref:Uncharacterized protein n=1 Tax=Rhizoctonia solani TaxID=456999 RepID=A0A8H3EAJ7_9AGAM|nr:unnamed protein product [Rhizoctonia solani]
MNIYLSSTSGTSFDLISTLSPHFQSVAGEIIKFASPHVKPTPEGHKDFNWTTFKDAIDRLPGVEMVIEGFNSPQTAKVAFNDLPSRCADSLIKPLSMPIDQQTLIEGLKKGFTDLKSGKEHGWADFRQISAGEPSKIPFFPPKVPPTYGWEYRTFVLADNRSRDSDVVAMVATFLLGSSKLAKEEDWYQLDPDSSEEITLDLKSMKLGVEQGFTAP